MAKRSSSPIDSGERQRLHDKFMKLIWDQLRPWAYMDIDGLEVRTFDGRMISFAPALIDGAPREALWNGNYIEPFLEEICREEGHAAARVQGRAREALRALLIAGITRVYLVMQEIDWHVRGEGADYNEKRPVRAETDRMITYLDRCLARADTRAA